MKFSALFISGFVVLVLVPVLFVCLCSAADVDMWMLFVMIIHF